MLRLAASLERGSEHPLATAIVSGAEERGLALEAAKEFRSETGKGVVGSVAARAVALGNRRLLDDLGVAPGALGERAEALRGKGPTGKFVDVDGPVAGPTGQAACTEGVGQYR